MPAVGVRREFLRAHWDGQFVRPIEEQDSSALFSLSQANALIERPEDSAGVKAGTDVPVIPIRNG
jgi:molybdopterin molybdotransferase